MKDQLSKAYSKRLFIILSLFFLMMTVALTVVQVGRNQNLNSLATSDRIDCSVGEQAKGIDAEEEKMLQLINTFRAEHSLQAVAFQDNLNRAAAWQSKDMAERNVMDHTDSGGREMLERVMNCNYYPSLTVAENIAVGPETPKEIFEGWKDSATHKENMLCAECTDIGIARDRQSNDRWYWTMDIGILKNISPAPSSSTSPSVSVIPSPSVIDEKGTPSPSPTPEVTLPPAQTTLSAGTTGMMAKVFMHGIDFLGGTSPLHPNRPLTVEILTPENTPVATVDGIVTFDPNDYLFKGAIAFPETLSTGTYIIKVKTDKSLAKIVGSSYLKVEKGQALTPDNIVLQNVDLDENNVINFADVLLFRKCLTDTTCPRSNADLNDDGEVDVADYGVILLVFGLIQGE